MTRPFRRSGRKWPRAPRIGTNQGRAEVEEREPFRYRRAGAVPHGDIVFLALHGSCGEDGRVQAALDVLGIPFTGADYLSSAIAMDKDLTKRLVAPAGIMTPKWEKISYQAEEIPAVVARTQLPVVVKPLAGGSSIGVSIARSPEELTKALEECLSFGSPVVLEQYITGREIQMGYLVDRRCPP